MCEGRGHGLTVPLCPQVRVPRPHVPGPGAGGAAGQGHHRGLSGGRGSTGTPRDHPPRQGDPPRQGGQEELPPGQRDPPFSGTPCRGSPTKSGNAEQGEPPRWAGGAQGGGQAPPEGLEPPSPHSTDRRTLYIALTPRTDRGTPAPPALGGAPSGGVIYFLFPPQVCNFDPIKICNGLRGAGGAGGHQELREGQGGQLWVGGTGLGTLPWG